MQNMRLPVSLTLQNLLQPSRTLSRTSLTPRFPRRIPPFRLRLPQQELQVPMRRPLTPLRHPQIQAQAGE